MDRFVTLLALASAAALIAENGFIVPIPYDEGLYLLLAVFNTFLMIRDLQTPVKIGMFKTQSQIVLLGLSLAVAGLFAASLAYDGVRWVLEWAALLLAVIICGERLSRIKSSELHPALVFVLSFLIMIVAGTLLLLLPNATPGNISLVDALFTATSAVCVTGLTVVTTGEDFTQFGQSIILFLLQLGGLGMLTFTNIFGLFFRSFGSFRHQLLLKDLINSRSMRGTKDLLVRILLFTLFVEGIGALLVYWLIGTEVQPDEGRWFFSVFHAVSAFCNAGFSTLPESFAAEQYRHMYGLHLVLAVLIILGGIGFNTIIGYIRFVGQAIRYYFLRLINRAEHAIPAALPVLSANNKLVIRSTGLLLAGGTLVFWLLERDKILEGYSLWGQAVTSFFGAVTPRTAGLNTVPTAELAMPTLIITMVLMWIGASPGSTGGGIKTTTFGLTAVNIWQQVLGRKRIVLGWKRVPERALNRALAIVMLSILWIGAATFFLTIWEPDKSLPEVTFECISAYSTVGLSLGITEELSTASKLMIAATMFVGRVSFLTLLSGIVRHFTPEQHDPAQFPKEDIFIN